jgi:cytochrome d ubiquinol oxidase subunit II
MSWVALIFTPIVLGYQSWSYWVFRKRLTSSDIPGAEQAPPPPTPKPSAGGFEPAEPAGGRP